jgi:protein-tyrosine-phosphatase
MKSIVNELPPQPGRTVLITTQAAHDPCTVLFVCHNNSTCSIIAEAILNRWGGKQFRAFSAGIQPASEVNPSTVKVLKERSLWKRSTETRSCGKFLNEAQCLNFIISIGEQRPDDLPTDWPGNPVIMHWRITEPIVEGKPANVALAFRRTFGELENRIKLFILIYEREQVKKLAA